MLAPYFGAAAPANTCVVLVLEHVHAGDMLMLPRDCEALPYFLPCCKTMCRFVRDPGALSCVFGYCLADCCSWLHTMQRHALSDPQPTPA